MFKEIVDPDFEYQNFSVEEQSKILAADRSNNYLDTTKLEKLYPDVRNIKDAVRECLIQYKDTYQKIVRTCNRLKGINTLFITGGAGFIGSNFVNYFCRKYPDVKLINFDALYYCGDLNNVDEDIRNSNNYQFIKGNLQEFDLLNYIFDTNEISHIIHFAAQSHVDNR
jgi:FlaA1/EpsC-like NDP-sugar epimerase